MADAPFVEYLSLLNRLKHLPRTGWVMNGVENCESVASHMYRMAVLVICRGADAHCALDTTRCMKMALVHDMAESIVGDITPHCNVSKEEKSRRELQAMNYIASLIPEFGGAELLDLFSDYEEGASDEAKFVHDLDMFDMVAQAYEYERAANRPGYLQPFFDSTVAKFRTPTVQRWFLALRNQREEWSSRETDGSQTVSQMDALNDEEFFMSVALVAALRCKDRTTREGACIVDRDGAIVSTGYNGVPRAVEKALDANGNAKETYTCHAEESAVINAVCPNLEGCTIYLTHYPCTRCTRYIVQSRIAKIVYLNTAHSAPDTNISRLILQRGGVVAQQWSGRRSDLVLHLGPSPAE